MTKLISTFIRLIRRQLTQLVETIEHTIITPSNVIATADSNDQAQTLFDPIGNGFTKIRKQNTIKNNRCFIEFEWLFLIERYMRLRVHFMNINLR